MTTSEVLQLLELLAVVIFGILGYIKKQPPCKRERHFFKFTILGNDRPLQREAVLLIPIIQPKSVYVKQVALVVFIAVIFDKSLQFSQNMVQYSYRKGGAVIPSCIKVHKKWGGYYDNFRSFTTFRIVSSGYLWYFKLLKTPIKK